MNSQIKSDWAVDFGENLNIEILRKKYSPPAKYRVSEYIYPAGTVTNGSMIKGICFAFVGRFTYRYNDYEVTLEAGEWAELPAGKFELIIDDNSDAKMVHVWEIPTKV